MYLLTKTLPTAEENLALDEALVEVADQQSTVAGSEFETLRLWELTEPCVVLGRASKWAEEVRMAECQRDGVPVLRRVSGGASIVAGPGCLMYSVLISYLRRPAWRALDIAHKEVMTRIRDAVQATTDTFHLHLPIAIDGTCDLTIGDRKFSGNALRCKRNWMLYHGTVMYAVPLNTLTDYLHDPPRQPQYRMHRAHENFVANLIVPSSLVSPVSFRLEIERQLSLVWSATEPWETNPLKEQVETECKRLFQNRYTDLKWHLDR